MFKRENKVCSSLYVQGQMRLRLKMEKGRERSSEKILDSFR